MLELFYKTIHQITQKVEGWRLNNSFELSQKSSQWAWRFFKAFASSWKDFKILISEDKCFLVKGLWPSHFHCSSTFSFCWCCYYGLLWIKKIHACESLFHLVLFITVCVIEERKIMIFTSAMFHIDTKKMWDIWCLLVNKIYIKKEGAKAWVRYCLEISFVFRKVCMRRQRTFQSVERTSE